MKLISHLPLWAATLLFASAPVGLQAADPLPSPPTDVPRQAGTPSNVNKASQLVGMEVRNQSDERLGKIDDIVVDLNTGKIAYTVLNAGNVFKPKYLAVPANAYVASTDHKHLVLTAEKSKIENAKGFDKNNWPSVSNPDWGAETLWEPRPSITPTSTLPTEPVVNPPNPTQEPSDDPNRQPKPSDKPYDKP